MKYLTGNRMFLLVACAVLISFAVQIPGIPVEAKTYPLFLLVASFVVGIALFVKKQREESVGESKQTALRIVLFSLLIIVYILAMPKISYLLSTLLFLYGGQWMLKLRKSIAFWVFPVVATATMYFLFTRVLEVLLPEGTWITLVL